jgi:hypothetical protein
MGRRSRKRSIAGPLPVREPGSPAAEPAPPPRAPATLRRRAPAEDRPAAPWGSFPLTELVNLVAIVLIITGFATQSFRVTAVGFALIALSAGELALREHFAGFRSHTTLLAMLAAGITAGVLVWIGAPRALQVGAAAAALGVTFLVMRRAFQRRAGGLGFRA